MIIWLSGPYGVGKSTLAEAMAEKMENSFIFDAEKLNSAGIDTRLFILQASYGP